MKKAIALALSLLMILVLFAGCAQSAPETPPVDDGGDEVIPPIDDTEEMNFFERIIAAIVEFFNNIVEKIKNIFA